MLCVIPNMGVTIKQKHPIRRKESVLSHPIHPVMPLLFHWRVGEHQSGYHVI